jgi:carbamoyltransferase
MIVLGLSGVTRDAAAALARDGVVVAAVREDCLWRIPGVGLRAAGGVPGRATAACLAIAGVEAGEVDQVVVARGSRPGRPPHVRAGRPAVAPPEGDGRDASGGARVQAETVWIDDADADAVLAAAVAAGRPTLTVALDSDTEADGWLLSSEPGDRPRVVRRLDGWKDVVRLARRVAASLSIPGGLSPGLGWVVAGAPGDPGAERCVKWTPEGFAVDLQPLRALLESAAIRTDSATLPAPSLHSKILDARRRVGEALLRAASGAVGDLSVALLAEAPAGARVGLAGRLFANGYVNTALYDRLGDALIVSPAPEAYGRALGAALLPFRERSVPVSMNGLGPRFTDQEVKFVLDNSRLDYVFDPDRRRLLRRVSSLLARGKSVAWFQGPMEFGARPLGGRVVLCDASDRFARDNILRHLRHLDRDDDLAVSVRDCDVGDCFLVPVVSPNGLMRGRVLEDWRNRFRAVLDAAHSCAVHTVSQESAPDLWELLAVHRERWGAVGLVTTSLAGVDEPPACTPRDAVRTYFSSPIDALAIGGFLLMKDYWLLRSDVDR